MDNPAKPPRKYRVIAEIECLYCGLAEITYLDLPVELTECVECPECGRLTRLDLAITNYLDESE